MFARLGNDPLLHGVDPDFALGRRAHLRYAFEGDYASWSKINEGGPEPFEYLEYAKSDLATGDAHGAINALGNAKRAVHFALVSFLRILGLGKAYSKAKFPVQLEIIREINAFPTRMLESLNQQRNLVEHEYESIDLDAAANFVDIAEMFLLLAYPYLRETLIGAYVGLEGDDRCLAWSLLPWKCEVNVHEIADYRLIDSPIGKLCYPRLGDKSTWTLTQTIIITKTNQEQWLPYLDFFVYWSKRVKIRPSKDADGHYGIFHQPIHWEFLGEDEDLSQPPA